MKWSKLILAAICVKTAILIRPFKGRSGKPEEYHFFRSADIFFK